MLDEEAAELDIAVPKLRLAPFETAIIVRYRRRESSVEESLIEMYLADVSVRRVEDREASLAKVKDVERKLREMKLNSATDMYAKGVGETLTYLEFPSQHWRNIRTNNILERLNREIRRRTRVVGCLQKHPRLGYENMQACFHITRLAAFSRTGNRP